MRKVTNEITKAFLAGESKTVSNTYTDGKAIFLHNNKIAEKRGTILYVTAAGWKTKTTKERLNALPEVSIAQKAGEWYLNGEYWDGNWTPITDSFRKAVIKANE